MLEATSLVMFKQKLYMTFLKSLYRFSTFNIFCLLVYSLLAIGCMNQGNNFKFNLLRHVQIDETDHIIKRPPETISCISTNRIAILSEGIVCIYDVLNGKLIRKFKPDTLLDDRLLAMTHPIDSSRGIIYRPRSPSADTSIDRMDIFSQLSHVDNFYYEVNRFYIIYTASVETSFTNYAAFSNQFSDSNDSLSLKLKQQTQLLPIENFISVQRRTFLIETDSLFAIHAIHFLDDATIPKSKWGTYAFMPESGFIVKGQSIYAPAHNQLTMFHLPDTMPLFDRDSLALIAEMKIDNPLKWEGEVLNTSNIPGFRTKAREHYANAHRFCQTEEGLLVQTYCGWYIIPEKERFHHQPMYNKNEDRTGDFDYIKKCMLYSAKDSTQKEEKKRVVFKVVAEDQTNPIFDTTMIGGGYFGKSIDAAGRLYYFINPSGENYYIDVYRLQTP